MGSSPVSFKNILYNRKVILFFLMENTVWYSFYKEIYPKKDFEKLLEFLKQPQKRSLRVNTKRISIKEFLLIAQKKKWKLTSIPWCKEGFWIEREDESIPLAKHLIHHAGYFYLQEASSMFPVTLFDYDEEGGQLILDMAAAPGSKSTQIENMTGHKTIIISNEPATSRLKAMASNLERFSTSTIVVSQKDGSFFGKIYPNTFDKVLLDAPCSGDGMIRKDQSILKSWSPNDSLFMAKLQKKLLLSAFESLKPGGQLIYSTCTFSPYENENVLQYLIDHYGDILETEYVKEYSGNTIKEFEGNVYDERIKAGIRILPWKHDSEGFFAIKIIKTSNTPGTRNQPLQKRNDLYLSQKKEQIIISYIQKHFGFDFEIPKKHVLIEKSHTIWMVPSRSLTEFSELQSPWPGMKIGELYNHDLKISHSFALEYGSQSTEHVYHLNEEELQKIMLGRDISIQENFYTGDILILRSQNVSIGVGKYLDGTIKNLLPRNMVVKQGSLY